MYFVRIVLSVLALLSAQTALAEEIGAASASKQSKMIACRRSCLSYLETCSARESAEKCDTRFVGCHLGCFACRGAADECADKAVGKSGGDLCEAKFVPCMNEIVAAREKETPIRFKGGNGRSEKTAILVVGAKSKIEGVTAESLWAFKMHSDWRKSNQALVRSGSQIFDRIGFDTPEGPQTVWFDISAFFGELGADAPLAIVPNPMP